MKIVIVITCVLAGVICFTRTTQAAETATSANINAQVQLDQLGRQIPPSFLGLSVEYSQISDLISPENGHQTAVINLVNNLQQYNGPFVFRIGGNSTDRTFWQGLPDTTPHFNNTTGNNANANNANAAQGGQANRKRKTAITLTPELISEFQGIAAGTHCKFILGLNLACDNPAVAMVWAKQAIAGLGSSIMAFEIGNEPSLYARNGYRPKGYSLAQYYKDFGSYVNALRPELTDGIQIAGGAICCGWLEETDQFVDHEHQNVNIVTVHLYPLSGGNPKAKPNPDEGENPEDNPAKNPTRQPSIANLLKDTSSTMYVTRGEKFLAAAANYDLPVRWAEMNSVNNGGNANVSGSFAASLWAVDTLFEIFHSGAVGVNFHMGADYPTFDFSGGQLNVCPLYYGQLFFAQAVQNHARLIPVNFQTTANVKIWATLDADHVLRVVAINKDLTQDVHISLHLPTNARAQLETLFAPSVEAKTGLIIYGDGAIINYDHSTNGKPGPVNMDNLYPLNQYITPEDGVYTFFVPHTLARMLIVQLN
ncbi:MAG TPA: hypothetical protein VMG59_11490 [Phycisphaerae bacterium]|nr:hypothetical protein [Phycisphaerae bacterium]